MSRIPVISNEKLCKLLARKGYLFDHQKGSHIVLRMHEFPYHRLTIPERREIPKGTLRAILRQAGLTLEEFMTLL